MEKYQSDHTGNMYRVVGYEPGKVVLELIDEYVEHRMTISRFALRINYTKVES